MSAPLPKSALRSGWDFTRRPIAEVRSASDGLAMKQIVLAVLLAVSAVFASDAAVAQIATSSAQTVVQPDAQAEPTMVLIQYDPWATVVGSDSPMFALYDDGTAIYRRGAVFYAAHLSASDLQAFLAELRPDRLVNQNRSIELSNSTDQPTTVIYVKAGSTYSHVSIYGPLRSSENSAALPIDVAEIYQRLSAFEWQGELPWLPNAVEVMIWPYEYAPEESIIWPENWPDTLHPDTHQRGDGYSIYIPATEYQALRDFLRTRRQRGAVLIDRRKWAVSVRLPFPKETRWMGQADE